MKYDFLTEEQYQKLLTNGASKEIEKNHVPVVKLFSPDAQATWLLTEVLPEEPDIAFGLIDDLGPGFPELGYVSLKQLADARGRLGLPMERDMHFEARYPLSVYTQAAKFKGRITDDPGTLEYFAGTERKKTCMPNSPQPS